MTVLLTELLPPSYIIYSFIVNSLTHLFLLSFICSFKHFIIHFVILKHTHSPIHLFTHLVTSSFIQPFIHFLHFLLHPLLQSLSHSLIQNDTRMNMYKPVSSSVSWYKSSGNRVAGHTHSQGSAAPLKVSDRIQTLTRPSKQQ